MLCEVNFPEVVNIIYDLSVFVKTTMCLFGLR